MVPRVYIVKPKISNQEIAKLEGTYFNDDDFDLIIKDDADVYRLDSDNKKHLLLKIRKNVIPKEICHKTFYALEKEAQKPHTNRGAAAGLLTKRKLPPYVKEIAQKRNIVVNIMVMMIDLEKMTLVIYQEVV